MCPQLRKLLYFYWFVSKWVTVGLKMDINGFYKLPLFVISDRLRSTIVRAYDAAEVGINKFGCDFTTMKGTADSISSYPAWTFMPQ